MPTTDIVNVNTDGGGDYTDLAAALLAEARDITVSDEIVKFRCAGSAADTAAMSSAVWASWICDATRYIQIEPASGQEHGGKWNTGVYRLEVTNASGIHGPVTVGQMYNIKVRGLQIRVIATTGSTSRFAVNAQSGINTNSLLDVQNCILRISKTGGTSVAHSGIIVNDAQWTTVTVGNNLIILDGTDVGSGIQRGVSGPNVYCHNTGVVGATIAFNDSISSAVGTVQVKDCWSYNSETFSAGAGIENSDYNSTDQPAATGGANDRVNQTFSFVDEGSLDYRPTASDTAIRGWGVDLSGDANLPITTDMTGAVVNSPPDIGPLNAEEAAGGPLDAHDDFLLFPRWGDQRVVDTY